jgi:hypothetical protein
MLDILLPSIDFSHFFMFMQDALAQAAQKTTEVATTTTPPTTTTVPPTIIQQVPTTSAATVDLTTLVGIITPILGGIAAMFFKQKKDIDKNDQLVDIKQKSMIEQMILPLLKQNANVVNQTATQDVKLNEAINLIYTTMGEQANNITGLPAIQQQKLLEDQIRSKIMAEQYQAQLNQVEKKVTAPVVKAKAKPAPVTAEPTVQWDESTQTWVSK